MIYTSTGSNSAEYWASGAWAWLDSENVQDACVLCSKPGPGLLQLADGEHVHRWPCRDLL